MKLLCGERRIGGERKLCSDGLFTRAKTAFDALDAVIATKTKIKGV
jgi:hypothetical protein